MRYVVLFTLAVLALFASCYGNPVVEPAAKVWRLRADDPHYSEHCQSIARIVAAGFDGSGRAMYRPLEVRQAVAEYIVMSGATWEFVPPPVESQP